MLPGKEETRKVFLAWRKRGCPIFIPETVTIDPDGSGSLPALTRILDRDQDTLGRERSTGILPVTNGAAEHSLTYAYDNSGRLSTVTSPAGTFSYTYTPNSSLIATVTGPVHTVTGRKNMDIHEI
jgi:YD repeat-containing protein